VLNRTRDLFDGHVTAITKSGVLDLGQSECWPWTGRIDRHGYGQIEAKSNGRRVQVGAHRAVYLFIQGDIPEDLVLDHLCRNRSCVNPSHLEPVTQAVNIQRGETGKHPTKRRLRSHCKRGHEFTPENTRPASTGIGRRCRECARIHRIRYETRKQVA